MRVDKMDKRALYDQFHRVESRISSMGADVKEIQEKMDDLIEENANLQIENQHLRDRIDFLTKEKEEFTEALRGRFSCLQCLLWFPSSE